MKTSSRLFKWPYIIHKVVCQFFRRFLPMSLFLDEFWGFLWFNPLNREILNDGSSTWCCTTFQQSWNSLGEDFPLASITEHWASVVKRVLLQIKPGEFYPKSWKRKISLTAKWNWMKTTGPEKLDAEQTLILMRKLDKCQHQKPKIVFGGSVTEWSACRTSVVPGSSLALTTTCLFLGSPEFKSSATLVNSQLVCLRLVRILNNVMFSLNYSFQLFARRH